MRRFKGNKGHYIYCDICGEATYSKDVVKLGQLSGRPGLLVCRKDADQNDYGLLPYAIKAERPVPWTSINHTNVENGAAIVDHDTL